MCTLVSFGAARSASKRCVEAQIALNLRADMTGLTFSCTIQSQVSVAYPTEVDDEYISDTEPYVTPQPEGTTSWVKGWNRVTDMYRVL